MKMPLLLKPGETRGAVPLNIFGGVIWIKLAGGDTDGSYAITEGTTPPTGGPPLHRHSREDESFYVLEGEFVFEADGKLHEAGPGCSIFLPRHTAHLFQNVGKTVGRLLSVVQPAGLEDFFTETDAATRGMKEADPSIVLPIFQKYGLELLGPPMAHRRPASVAS
jgi:quercetin dioxygenase-like cupin family protein